MSHTALALVRDETPRVRDEVGASDFTGYDSVDGTGKVLALLIDGAPVQAAAAGETVPAVRRRQVAA